MARLGPIFWLILFGSFWGLTIPLTKIAMSTGYRPIGLIFWQQIVVAIVLLALLLALGRFRALRPRLKHLDLYIGIALIGTVIPNNFSYLAAANLPAGIVGIAIATVPMFALLIALGLRDERLEPRRLLGILLGASAVVLLIGPEASLPEPGLAIFVFIALVAPFCYGLEANYLARRAPPGLDPMVALFWSSIVGATMTAPMAFFTGNWVDLTAGQSGVEWAVVVVGFCQAVAYSGYIWLVRWAGAVFTSQISYVVTIMTVLLSAFLLGERYAGWVWLALVLMLVGLALVRPNKARRRSEPADAPAP